MAARGQLDDGQAAAVYRQAIAHRQAASAAGHPNDQFERFLSRLDSLDRSGLFDKASKHAAESLKYAWANPKRILALLPYERGVKIRALNRRSGPSRRHSVSVSRNASSSPGTPAPPTAGTESRPPRTFGA